jgi:HemK-like putative methylase
VSELLQEIRGILQSAQLPSAEADAEALVRHGQSAKLSPEGVRELAQRRVAGAPLGLLLGVQRFMGVELYTSENVLVPREETEILGTNALRILKERAQQKPQRIVDMCCGAGNLACGLASGLPGLSVWATDLSDACVNLARRNVGKLSLGDRVKVLQGDLFASIREAGLSELDAVVCNPPYISSTRLGGDRAVLLQHEPKAAFDGGPYGLTIHQRVVQEAKEFLSSGGWLMFEFGAGQDKLVQRLFDRNPGYDAPTFFNDSNGTARAVAAQKKA